MRRIGLLICFGETPLHIWIMLPLEMPLCSTTHRKLKLGIEFFQVIEVPLSHSISLLDVLIWFYSRRCSSRYPWNNNPLTCTSTTMSHRPNYIYPFSTLFEDWGCPAGTSIGSYHLKRMSQSRKLWMPLQFNWLLYNIWVSFSSTRLKCFHKAPSLRMPLDQQLVSHRIQPTFSFFFFLGHPCRPLITCHPYAMLWLYKTLWESLSSLQPHHSGMCR